MNRASRRAAARAKPRQRDDQLGDGIGEITRQSAGLLSVFILSPEDGFKVLAAALAGSAECLALFKACEYCAERIERAPADDPVLCLTCTAQVTTVRGGTWFCVTVPATDQPALAIGSAICSRCAAHPRADIEARVFNALREMIWPELRPIVLSPGSGSVQ